MKKTILFQGDSITDAYRRYENPDHLGIGYANDVASRMGLDYPNAYTFVNKGISGNRIVDLYARIKSDILNIKPDYMSILIGVNDVWHELMYQNGVDTEKFKKIYTMLLEEVFAALPNVKIMLLEPFVAPGSATNEQIEKFREEVAKRAAVVHELGAQFGLPVIELQKDLDAMLEKAPEGYWLWDGVHPSVFFHQYIADKWIAQFQKLQEDCR